MIRLACALLLVVLAGCPGRIARPYPPAAPADLIGHLKTLPARARALRAETKTDVRLGKDRANLTVLILAAWGGKLRFQALFPNQSMAADLAADGARYCFVDVQNGCAECGRATPDNVARLIRIRLEPDDVVAVLLGGTPLLADADPKIEWDDRHGREIVTLAAGGATQRVVLDGRERRWDVLESHLRDAEGKTVWRIRHKDFHRVGEVRLPGASLFEQAGDTVRIEWKEQVIPDNLPAAKFQFTPQAGLPPCSARANVREPP